MEFTRFFFFFFFLIRQTICTFLFLFHFFVYILFIGALKVKDEQIISEKNKFFFSAYSNDPNTVKKKYVVDIDLLHDIINSVCF